MKERLFAPVHLLAAAVVIGIAVVGACTWFAADQPWLGLGMTWSAKSKGAVVYAAQGPSANIPVGTVMTGVSGSGDALKFIADDFVVEPDGSLATYRIHDAFLERSGRLSRMQHGETITFTDAKGGTWPVHPAANRPWGALGPGYWVQIVVGLFAWLISSCIWAFRPKDTAARYLLLSGFSTLIFAPFAAVYTTRELGLPTEIFRQLDDLNFFGGSLFAACLVCLLLYYPRRIAPRWVGLVVVAAYVGWYVAQENYVFDSMPMARRVLVMAGLVATTALAGVQWRLTARDPIARAALQWFLLSWLVGAGLFFILILAPGMVGIDTSALQGYAFLLFLLVYGGLAFGITRFRLFELGEWWLRTVLWTTGVFLLVMLDLAFVAWLQLSSSVSLSLALLICCLVWLPFRSWLWGRFFTRSRRGGERALFEQVVGVALAPRGEEQQGLWEALMRATYDPLKLEPAPRVAATEVADNGLALMTPAVDELPGLRMEYASGGRRLFNRRDAGLAEELVGMLRHVLQSRRAYEEGVAGERRRIARDVHDNIGSQLMRALHSSGEERKDRLIRETLTDLGGIINDPARLGASLDEILAGLRVETAERMSADGVVLDWPMAEGEDAGVAPAVAHTLRSVIREAVNNVAKHARASRLKVLARRAEDAVDLRIEDDGVGFDPVAAANGNGLANMQSRVESLGGRIAWARGADRRGMTLTARLPLKGRA